MGRVLQIVLNVDIEIEGRMHVHNSLYYLRARVMLLKTNGTVCLWPMAEWVKILSCRPMLASGL
jgi:hypothetical protein